MRLSVISHVVWCHGEGGIRFVDVVINRPIAVVVVGRAGEAPRIIEITAGVGVSSAGHIDRADRGSGLAVYTRDGRDGGRVRLSVIRPDDRCVGGGGRRMSDGAYE